MAALGTLVSTTMEGALVEILESLSDLQAASALTDTPETLIDSYSRDGLSGLITVSLTMPSTSNPDTNGKPTILATEVF